MLSGAQVEVAVDLASFRVPKLPELETPPHWMGPSPIRIGIAPATGDQPLLPLGLYTRTHQMPALLYTFAGTGAFVITLLFVFTVMAASTAFGVSVGVRKN